MTAPISRLTSVVVHEELPPPVTDDRLRAPSACDPRSPMTRQARDDHACPCRPFSVAQLFHAVCGIALAAFGAVTMAKAGFDRPLGEQTAEV